MRQMALEWGVTPILIKECGDVEELWTVSIAAAREAGLVESGDRVVITAGTAVNIPGLDERHQGRYCVKSFALLAKRGVPLRG